MTPTPRTDEQNCGWWNHPSCASFTAVPIDFARQLERELHAARDMARGLAEALQELRDWQNGPPLDTAKWLKGWGEAMGKSEAALALYAAQTKPEQVEVGG